MARAQSETSRWRPSDRLLLAGLAALVLAVRASAGLRTIDDAYITFRYARNLAEGLGFVYNAGERVMGTTTPLYTGLMALAWTLGLRDLPVVALVVNSLADVLTACLLYRLALRLEAGRPGQHRTGTGIVALGLGLAWALSPMSVTFAVGGMETEVVILFLVAAFAAYAAGRTRLSAALMALAVLTRPDALIAAGLLFAGMGLRPLLARDGAPLAIRLRRLPWVEAAIFAGLLLPWLVFATVYFGSPLPQSVAAKVRAYQLGSFSALIRLLQHLSVPFFEYNLFGRFWPALGLPLYLTLFGLGAVRMVRCQRRCLPLVLYPLVYVALFSAANPLIFRWYLAPPLPLYFLGILVGLRAALGGLARSLGRPRWATAATAAAVAMLLLFSLSEYRLHPDHGPDRPAPEMAWFKLEQLYRQAAEWIKPALQPGDVVAAGDIGAVGWFSEAPILDTLGLISPQSIPYYPLDPEDLVITYAIAPDLIRDEAPAYLITLEVYVRHTLLPADWFGQEYRLVRQLETDIYGSDGMLIFERVR